MVSNSSRSRSILVRYLVLAERTMSSISLELPPESSSSVEGFEVLESYRGGGGVIVFELLRRVMGRPVREVLRSLRSFEGVMLVFLVRPNMFRLGTDVGAGMRTASSSFFFGDGRPLRSLTLARRINLPVPRLTLLHMLFLGLSFSSST